MLLDPKALDFTRQNQIDGIIILKPIRDWIDLKTDPVHLISNKYYHSSISSTSISTRRLIASSESDLLETMTSLKP